MLDAADLLNQSAMIFDLIHRAAAAPRNSTRDSHAASDSSSPEPDLPTSAPMPIGTEIEVPGKDYNGLVECVGCMGMPAKSQKLTLEVRAEDVINGLESRKQVPIVMREAHDKEKAPDGK